MNLYKINKEYSLFLFFFNIFILFTVSEVLKSKEIEIPFKNIICFFLISIILKMPKWTFVKALFR